MFPCQRAAHSGFIDTKCGLLKVCGTQSDRSTLVKGQDSSRATGPPLMQSPTEADSCAYKGQTSSWCNIAFYCFLAKDIVHRLIGRYLRIICFCGGWPPFSRFFLSRRERLHNCLTISMGRLLIGLLSVFAIECIHFYFRCPQFGGSSKLAILILIGEIGPREKRELFVLE